VTYGDLPHPNMCILDVGPLLLGRSDLTGLHTWMRSDRHARPRAFAAVVLLCVALLALLTVIQVAHVHSVDTDADHCPLCIVLHTAAPVAAAAVAVVLVHIESVTAVVAVRPIASIWHRQLFIRPPPSVSPASF
jgi:hypothetical protein